MPVGWTWVVRGTAVQITRAGGRWGTDTPRSVIADGGPYRPWTLVSMIGQHELPEMVAVVDFLPSVVDVGEWNALGRVAGPGFLRMDEDVGVSPEIVLASSTMRRSEVAQLVGVKIEVQAEETALDEHFEEVQGSPGRDRHVPTAVGMLPVSDDLHALVAQLAAREQIVVVHDPLSEAVDLVEDGPREIVLEADLPGRHGTELPGRCPRTA